MPKFRLPIPRCLRLLFLLILSLGPGLGFANDFESALMENSSLMEIGNIPDALKGNQQAFKPAPKKFVTDFKIDENQYTIGPGDQFEITIEDQTDLKSVNPEGQMVFNNIGMISVEGLLLSEAKKVIVDSLKKHHHIARIFASLAYPKTVRVFVTGAVGLPGIYEAPATHRITDLLSQAQWFRNDAKKTEIHFTPKGGETQHIDIKEFLLKGNLEANPYILPGAVLHIPFIDFSKPIVNIRFQTWNIEVQLEENETIHDLLLKFYSYRNETPRGKILLHEPGQEMVILSQQEASQKVPAAGSLIEISEEKNQVYVGGAVLKPGFVPYNPKNTVSQYIAHAGLISTSKLSDRVLALKNNGTEEKRVGLNETLEPGDAVLVKENMEKKFTTWAPILLSVASVAFAIMTLLIQ